MTETAQRDGDHSHKDRQSRWAVAAICLLFVAAILVVWDVLSYSQYVGRFEAAVRIPAFCGFVVWALAILLALVACLQVILKRRRWQATALALLLCGITPLLFYLTFQWWPTPNRLVLAAAASDKETVERCLRWEIDVDSTRRTPPGLFGLTQAPRTAMEMAVDKGHYEIVRLLVDGGSDVNRIGQHGMAPLHRAAARPHPDITLQLLELGADVSLPTKGGMRAIDMTIADRVPLQNATDNGLRERRLATARVLVNRGADLERPAVHLNAMALYRPHMAVALAKWRRERARNEPNPLVDLLNALALGECDNALRILEDEPNLDGLPELQWRPGIFQMAARFGCANLVENRLTREPPIAEDLLALVLAEAAAKGHLEVVKLLLDHGADISKFIPASTTAFAAGTPLHNAALYGHRDIARFLIDSGADVNAAGKSDPGYTPLTAAVYQGHLGVVKVLVESGADTTRPWPTRNGRSMPELADYGGHSEISAYLREHGRGNYPVEAE